MKIAIIFTCFNRLEKTKACIESLIKQDNNKFLKFYVTDDSSSDGTREMLEELKQTINIEIIGGNGSLYWNKGMHKAFGKAIDEKSDIYLWINDDVEFYMNAIKILLDSYNNSDKKSIIVGSTVDNDTKCITYGGVIQKHKFKKVKYDIVDINEVNKECDTMNGNCVLIPHSVVEAIGNIDPIYEHGMGDYDYGLRAKKKGFKILIADEYIGTCSRNRIEGTWRDRNLSLKKRIDLVKRPTGLPIKSWYTYTKKYAGSLWIIWFLSPYIKLVVSSILYKRGN